MEKLIKSPEQHWTTATVQYDMEIPSFEEVKYAIALYERVANFRDEADFIALYGNLDDPGYLTQTQLFVAESICKRAAQDMREVIIACNKSDDSLDIKQAQFEAAADAEAHMLDLAKAFFRARK